MLSEIIRLRGVVNIVKGNMDEGLTQMATASMLDNTASRTYVRFAQPEQPAYFNVQSMPNILPENTYQGPGPVEIVQGAVSSIQESANSAFQTYNSYVDKREQERKQQEMQRQAEILKKSEWQELRNCVHNTYISAIEFMQNKSYGMSEMAFKDAINNYTNFKTFLSEDEKTKLLNANRLLEIVQRQIAHDNALKAQHLALPDLIARKVLTNITKRKNISAYDFDQASDIVSNALKDNIDLLNLSDNSKIENDIMQIVNQHIMARYKVFSIFCYLQPYYLPSDTKLDDSLREHFTRVNDQSQHILTFS